MRDLARTGIGRRKKTSRKKLFLYIGVFIILGIVLYYVGGDAGNGNSKVNDVVADAPPNMMPVSLADQENISSGGVSLTTDTASMKDLRNEGASATVTRAYGGGAYRLSVNANLPDPVNVNYAVWLVGDKGPILIDYMRGSGRNWSLGLSGTESKYLGYNGVLITLERTKDNKPEEKIMSGSF
jgi:hypothetical protein